MNDKDKIILLQNLHDEYRKNPDWNGGLPMSKEEVEHFLQENAALLQNLEDQDDEVDEIEDQEDEDAQSSGQDVDDQQQIDIDSNEIVVENVDENGQVIHTMQQ